MARKDNIALTWQQSIAIVLVIMSVVLGLAAGANYTGNPQDIVNTRIWFGITSSICVLAWISLFYWHHRVTHRPDIYPDVLAAIFGGDNIYEIKGLHFHASGRQLRQGGPQARVIVVLQSVYADPCHGRLALNAKGTTQKIPNVSDPLTFTLHGAEILACWRDFPLPATGALSFGFDMTLNRTSKRRVRFRRRIAIRTDSASNAMLVAGLATGHLFYHGGSRLEFPLSEPPPDALQTIVPTSWLTMSLWSLQDQRTVADIRSLLGKLLED